MMNEIIRYSIAGLFTLCGITGSTMLLLRNKVGQPTYCFVLILSVFIGMWIGYSDRIKEFTVGLGQMNMVLLEMKETQQDVKKREEKIVKLAASMGDLITFIEATSLTMHRTDAEDEWLKIKLDILSSISDEKIDNPFSRLSSRLSTHRPGDETQRKQIWEDFRKDVEADVQKLKSR